MDCIVYSAKNKSVESQMLFNGPPIGCKEL